MSHEWRSAEEKEETAQASHENSFPLETRRE